MIVKEEILKITKLKDGCRFTISVTPKSSKNRIEGIHDGMLKVSVSAPPEKGKANEAVIKILSKELGIPKSSIEIISGETSRKKVIFVKGLEPDFLLEMLI